MALRSFFVRAVLFLFISITYWPAIARADAPAIQLEATDAILHGNQIRIQNISGANDICFWLDVNDWAEWKFTAPAAGRYDVEMEYACQDESKGSKFDLDIAGQKIPGSIEHGTGTWYDHETMHLGHVTIEKPGDYSASVKATSKPGQAVMNLTSIRLIPAESGGTATTLPPPLDIYLIPNFHPASCGWLVDFSIERNHCANGYIAHLNRVRDDPNYRFALSEINNIIAMMQFYPDGIDELKKDIADGRIECVNAFFLEPTISLAGGEAMVKQGVEGLRWYRQVLNAKPRFVWGIDLCGVHEQAAQITAGLGLEGFVYMRDNPTHQIIHWLESPDGTRTLAFNSPDGYAGWSDLFGTGSALSDKKVKALVTNARRDLHSAPAGAPALIFGGFGDYSQPPPYKKYPTEFLAQLKKVAPEVNLHITGPGAFLDAVAPKIKSGEMKLSVAKGGVPYNSYTSFWSEMPRVKQEYRRSEHELQAAEAIDAVASLQSDFTYPVQPLYHGWLQMMLNMDRNTLWGAARGLVFESPTSWDAQDRFNSVEKISADNSDSGLRSLLGSGKSIGLFNFANWKRNDPITLKLPAGMLLKDVACQPEADGSILCRPERPSIGVTTLELEPQVTTRSGIHKVELPAVIETKFYSAKIDSKTGALISLKLRSSGKEMLAGPVQLVAEKAGDYHETPLRSQRERLADQSQYAAKVSAEQGELATVVHIDSTFLGGGKFSGLIHFYNDSPRIDFDTDLNDVPETTVVGVEMPLAGEIREARRGIPYGFSDALYGSADTHSPLASSANGILPAIRWSDYTLAGGSGLAILDRGLVGRELLGNSVFLMLLNTHPNYGDAPCPWLSGKGPHHFSYALSIHDGDWAAVRIPQSAWEFNAPPIVVENVAATAPKSFVETSDNVVVEAVRREAGEIEIRLVECRGQNGSADVTINLPHTAAALTNLIGENRQPLTGGPQYHFPVRPQQIVTLRLTTAKPVPDIQPLLKWDELVPPAKLEALHRFLPKAKGIPVIEEVSG